MFGWRAGKALPHLRKEVWTLTDYGSAPWRAIPSYPEGRKTGLPGASINNTGDGAWAYRTILRAFLRAPAGAYQQHL